METIPLSPLQESLQALPACSGVYEMKNETGETLYVGKAKTLKQRVRSYFQDSAKHSKRIQKLIEKVHHVEWTETKSEIEALILENNLIKEKYPKFNILLRDDKTYAYIKITNEDFPRIILVRKVLKDGAKYFGPKTSTSAVRKTIDVLQDILHFRSTPLEMSEDENGEIIIKAGNQKYPCLNYHLKKCDAPCIGNISKADYAEKVTRAVRFLKGDIKEIITQTTIEMMEHAKNGKFELAAKSRDTINAIEKISEKQIISAPNEFSADVIGIFSKFGHVFFHVFSLREGKIINSETFPVAIKNESFKEEISHSVQCEALSSFLHSHPNRVSDIPKSIVIDENFMEESEKEMWQEFFFSEWKQKLEISLPQKGKRKELVSLAHQNAESYAKRHAMSFIKNVEETQETLESLQQKLKMKTLPNRMECYDISHFSGVKTVASMVVFVEGKAKNSDYRSFNIKSLKALEIDDFQSLAEVIDRRLARLPEKFDESFIVEKVKRKKDFIEISDFISSSEEIKGLSSAIKNSTKKTKTFLWEKTTETVLFSLFHLVKNHNEQTGKTTTEKIMQTEFSVSLSKIENIENTKGVIHCFSSQENTEENLDFQAENKHWRQLLHEVFIKARCDFFTVYCSNKSITEYLEHLGFENNRDENDRDILEKSWKKETKNSFLHVPDLLVIDGGKGQLSSTWAVLRESEYAEKITICSLAKREEEVFSIDENGEIYKTEIKKESDEGHMLQRIRDEAHRFAITKNRAGREKLAQKSALDEIRGVGGKTKKILKETFGSVAGIRNASDEELLKFVNAKILQRIREKI